MESIARHRLVDGLCSNLSVLCLSASALTAADDAADEAGEREASAAAHRSALHAYVFFLSWLCGVAEAEARAAAPAAPAGAPCVVQFHTISDARVQRLRRPLSQHAFLLMFPCQCCSAGWRRKRHRHTMHPLVRIDATNTVESP